MQAKSPYDQLIRSRGPNPFAAALPPPAPAEEEGPEFASELRGPIVEDVHGEIGFLKELRETLQASIKARSVQEVEALVNRIKRVLKQKLEKQVEAKILGTINEVVEGAILRQFSGKHLTLNDAKGLKDLSQSIGKMVKQYRDLSAGMTVHIEHKSEDYEKLMQIIFEVIPQQYQLAIADRLEVHATKGGEDLIMEM